MLDDVRSSQEDEQPFTVLMVCTANLCRSPMMEFLLRAALAQREIPWHVTSCGIRARGGHAMHPLTAAVLREQEITVAGWISSRTERATVDRADLILTATARQRSQVIELQPRALARTFPLLQFARFAAHAATTPPAAPADRQAGFELVKAALAARSQVQPGPPAADDIVDPLGKSVQEFRRTLVIVEEALGHILSATGH